MICILCNRDLDLFSVEDINPNATDDPGCCPACGIPYMQDNSSAKKLWESLGDVPINENEQIDIDWRNFPKGTHRDDFSLGYARRNLYHHLKESDEYDNKTQARILWRLLGDCPIDENECIDVQFLDFPIGTHREDIWHWFEDTFDVRVHDLMYGAE